MWILLTLPGIYHVWLCMYSKPIELLFLAEANTRTLKTQGMGPSTFVFLGLDCTTVLFLHFQ